MAKVSFFSGKQIPLEMHKVRIVQKLNPPPVEQRLQAMTEAGNNTFLLQNDDVFMDMLTDSGVNAMSDQQQAAMMIADDSTPAAPPIRVWRTSCAKFSAWSISCPRTRAAHAKTSWRKPLSSRGWWFP